MRTVRILRRDQEDAAEIFAWISARSPNGAARWHEAFLQSAADLNSFPERFELAPESPFVGYDIRQRFFKTRRGRRYRLLYLIVDQEIRVLRVRGPGQPLVRPADFEL